MHPLFFLIISKWNDLCHGKSNFQHSVNMTYFQLNIVFFSFPTSRQIKFVYKTRLKPQCHYYYQAARLDVEPAQQQATPGIVEKKIGMVQKKVWRELIYANCEQEWSGSIFEMVTWRHLYTSCIKPSFIKQVNSHPSAQSE